MGLVEGVFGKIRHLVVDVVGRALLQAVVHAALHALLRIAVDEILTLLLHHRGLFLAHGTAHQVRAAHGVARQVPHDLHHLLLVDDTAVGGSQNGFHLRAVVGNGASVVLALDVLGDKVHGSRPVQGNSGDDVLQAAGLKLLHETLHAAAFQLEHPLGLARADGIQNLFVVVVDVVQINGHMVVLLGHVHRVLDHRQGPKAQEVHFQKPQLLDGGHGELGGDGAVRRPGQGHELVDGTAADHHARRVHGGVSGKSLQTLGHVDQVVDRLIFIIRFFQIGIHDQRFIQRHAQIIGDHFRDGIAECVGQIQHPAHVPDHALGRQGTEGDDLHHLIFSIFFHHIVDDFLPPLIAEVHVDIGHGHALRVQETLEQQIVADGIDVGDAQAVADNTAGRGASPRSYGDSLGSGVVDKVPDNQEIVHITHGADHVQLVVQALPQGPVVLRVMAVKALHAQVV